MSRFCVDRKTPASFRRTHRFSQGSIDRAFSRRKKCFYRDDKIGPRSSLLSVQSVYRLIVVIGLDVRIDVRPVFAGVHAVRALESRRLTTFVFQMSVKSPVPFVGLLTLWAAKVTSRRGVHRR